MRPRTAALGSVIAVAAGAAAGLVWWRRRSSAPEVPGVQLGLRGGGIRALDRSDPSTAELEALAAAVSDSLTGGA